MLLWILAMVDATALSFFIQRKKWCSLASFSQMFNVDFYM